MELKINNILRNKKILFFSPSFFNYEQTIKNKMIEMGADVYFFDERPFDSSYQKAVLKIQPNFFSKKTEKYFDEILTEVADIDFEFVFFLKCETPTTKVMEKYRTHFKNAKFCLYMWDSMSNVKNIESKLKYFDLISSFDKRDSLNNNFNFRPLFFSDNYSFPYKETNFKYDICSFGTIHSDRYKIISKIKQISDEKGLRTYFFNYLQGKFMFYYYKISQTDFKSAKLTDFTFEKKSSDEITKVIKNTQAVLDIQHPKQTGLTMRTIEMIGMNKKIITTNSAVTEYDFYHPNNILIINRDNITIDIDFLKKPYVEIAERIYQKYSLNQWVIDTLGVGNEE